MLLWKGHCTSLLTSSIAASMSFWLYFSTSIIASTAVFVEAAKGTSLVRESGIRGSVSCEEEKKVDTYFHATD